MVAERADRHGWFSDYATIGGLVVDDADKGEDAVAVTCIRPGQSHATPDLASAPANTAPKSATGRSPAVTLLFDGDPP